MSTSDQNKGSDGVVTIVLTANNHLGYIAFGQQPRKREELQQRLRQAFQQATDFAIGQGVDLFIQAGDLFDTPNPDERDRSFVAARLAQLRQAGIRTFALGGVHDTPPDAYTFSGEEAPPPPQLSYHRLGALHYLPPQPVRNTKSGSASRQPVEIEPVMIDVHGVLVGICGLGVLAGQEGDPLALVRPQDDLERAIIRLLILHAPIENLTTGSTLIETRSQVSQSTILNQAVFRYILAGYTHGYRQLRLGQSDLIAPGATQRIDFNDPESDPGFVFIGLAADGIRWCKHIAIDSLLLQRIVISTNELWPNHSEQQEQTPTDIILERLRPLCNEETMVQLRLEGEMTRGQYHQLNLNQIRRYGEENCFALAIDDSALSISLSDFSGQTFDDNQRNSGVLAVSHKEERFSPREELIALADEWIAASADEQEKKALRATKEELLAALDEVKSKR